MALILTPDSISQCFLFHFVLCNYNSVLLLVFFSCFYDLQKKEMHGKQNEVNVWIIITQIYHGVIRDGRLNHSIFSLFSFHRSRHKAESRGVGHGVLCIS